MLEEGERMDPGEYRLLDIGNMFLDCADRAIALPTDRDHVAVKHTVGVCPPIFADLGCVIICGGFVKC